MLKRTFHNRLSGESRKRKLFLSAFLMFFALGAALSQGITPNPQTEQPDSPDSTLSTKISPACTESKSNSVFDCYWVTTCLKCGWKSTDTAMVGTGLECCDSLYPFVMPVDGKLWRGCSSYHAGWDIGSAYGTPIKAAMSGMVRYASYCHGYGKLVIIRHFSGMEMYYAHMSQIKVKPGQWVEPGDIIGLVGATGHARGSHLHMEFRVCDRALDIADYYTKDDTVVNLYKIKQTTIKESQPSTATYHVVVKGDTLYAIALHFGTTVNNLCTLNHISKTSTLRIGQNLKVR